MGTRHLTELTRPGVVQRLLIRGTNWLGDAVLMSPALSVLRAGFPQAHIALLVKPVVGELFQGHPAVDEIIVYRKPGIHGGVGGKWSLARALRKRRFDLAVLFQNAFEAALIAALAGIPNRYGYATDGRRFLLTHCVSQIPGLRQKHQVEYYLELLRPLGLPVAPCAPSLRTTSEENMAAMEQLRGYGIPVGRPIIGLNPGSSYGTAKRWPADRYADVADRLAAEHGAHILIFGGPGEEALGASISSLMSASNTVLSGRTTVRQLMALLRQCRLLITNDAGPMHIAKAFGVPVVAIFGPTDPAATAPFGIGHEIVRRPVECSPCLLRECPIDHRCMRGISADMVHAAAGRQLRQNGVAPGTNQNAEAAPVVYLDRDGTLNFDPGYLNNPESMRLLPGVGSAIARLNRAGFKTVLVTNQSGVGRGLIRVEALNAIHERLRELLAESGAWLDGIYACPHRPEEACACRKPASGLVTRARQELALSPERSFVIGDRAIDIELARNIGARGIFVLSGDRPDDERAVMLARGITPDHVARYLGEAVDWVLQHSLASCDETPAREKSSSSGQGPRSADRGWAGEIKAGEGG
jgi:heptosyltransferase-2